MKKTKVLSLLIASCVLAFGCAAFAQEEDKPVRQRTHEVSGMVVSTDWVGSKVTIDAYGLDSADSGQLTFYVPQDAVLTRGTETIMLSDVEQSDMVQIEFVGDPLDNPKVVRLIDTNMANAE